MIERNFPLLRERYYEEVLPNGLTIRVVPRPGFAKKYAFLGVNFGSIDTKFEVNGKTYVSPDGVAHYLEHKMFDLPDGNAMHRFAQYGASDNAFTSYTMTAYYFDCADHFEENLETLITMVCTPYFTEQSVEKERGIIAQEIRMYEDSPGSAVSERLFAAAYAEHPIRVPIAGTVESIGEITAQTLQDCYDAFYHPSNMMLCVVGDVDAEAVIAQTAQLLPGEGKPRPVSDYGHETSLEPKTARTECCMEVSMPTFQIGFPCTPPASPEEILEQEIIADLAIEVLVGESSSLYNEMYAEGLVDSSFGCGYDELKGMSMLTCGGDSDDPDAVLSRILAEAERLQREGVDPALFERLKRSAIGSRIRELDSFSGIASRLCGYFFEGVEYYDFPAVYERVTEQQILDLLAEAVRPERAAISIVRPREKEQAE